MADRAIAQIAEEVQVREQGQRRAPRDSLVVDVMTRGEKNVGRAQAACQKEQRCGHAGSPIALRGRKKSSAYQPEQSPGAPYADQTGQEDRQAAPAAVHSREELV